MAEKRTQIQLTETEDGFSLEVKGKSIKEMARLCCVSSIPMKIAAGQDCCPPEECCPPQEKQTR